MRSCVISKVAADMAEVLMVAELLERRSGVVSVEDKLAALHIAENSVSEWVALRSWFEDVETVADPPFYQPQKVVRYSSIEKGGKENERSDRFRRDLCVEE